MAGLDVRVELKGCCPSLAEPVTPEAFKGLYLRTALDSVSCTNGDYFIAMQEPTRRVRESPVALDVFIGGKRAVFCVL